MAEISAVDQLRFEESWKVVLEKKKKKEANYIFLKRMIPRNCLSKRNLCVLLRWPSEMAKSGQLCSRMIQGGERLFEQRRFVGRKR